jgi:hypothetical protein
MINYDVVVFHKDVRVTQLPTAFYFNFLYAYACSKQWQNLKILENFVFIKQEQRRRGTCWGIDTRPSTIDIMKNVPEACSCTIFKLSNSLALGIIREYRVDSLTFT